jgi:cytochrome P450
MSAISSVNAVKEPPIVKGLPIIGNAHQFLAARGIPIDLMLQAHKDYGDLVQFKMGRQSIYLAANPELSHEILVKRVSEFHKAAWRNNKASGLGRFLGQGILTAQYEEWRPQRKLIQPLMHSQTINNYAEAMADSGEKLLSLWQNGITRNIHRDMMQVTMWIIAETMLGMDATHSQKIEKAAAEAQAITVADVLLPLPAWLTKGRDRQTELINEYLTELVTGFMNERRKNGNTKRHDLLTLLMESRDEDGHPMSDELVRDNILTLFFAGHETTANTLTWAFYYLDKYPDVAAKLHEEVDRVLAGRRPTLADLADLPYTMMLIKETLRIEPTVAAIPRIVAEDTMLQGYLLKANSAILVSPHLLHHDSRFWENPEAFQPERFSEENEAKIPKYAYLPFGGGPRICIGNHFALMEAQILLALIASRYKLSLNPRTNIKPLRQVTSSPEGGLSMRVEQR